MRGREHRAFRRLTGARLEQLLPSGTGQGSAPPPGKPAGKEPGEAGPG